MSIKLRSGGVWKNVNKAYLRSGGVWKNITKAYIRSGGVWKSMFGFISNINDPSIAQQVTLVRSSSTMPATLTGRNYRWTNATTLTYKFQYNNGSQWLSGNGTNATGTITNPSVGSSNTKIYTPIIGDFPSSSGTSTGSFRFVVTATNTNVSPSLQTVSTSDTVTIENSISPVTPTISMSGNSNISETTGTINWTSTNQASFALSGSFSDSGTTATSVAKTGLIGGTTYSGTVTVTSSTGNTASANYSFRTNDPVLPPVNQTAPELTQTSTVGMSVTKGSWTNNPTSYRYRWYELVNDSIEIVRDVTNSNTSDSYSGIIGRDYLVQVTAINSGGAANKFSNVLPLAPPTCTAGCGSYGAIQYGAYSDCVNCSKSRTRSQTRTCTNTDCTTYTETLNLTDETTSCSCPTFEGDWSAYGPYGPYSTCSAVGCLAIKFRTRTRTRVVQDACCNLSTQTQTQEQSTYCTVTRYKCSNFDVVNSNSVNYFDCFTVGACTAPQDPQCVREACQFS